jgi:hypothetical protein
MRMSTFLLVALFTLPFVWLVAAIGFRIHASCLRANAREAVAKAEAERARDKSVPPPLPKIAA